MPKTVKSNIIAKPVLNKEQLAFKAACKEAKRNIERNPDSRLVANVRDVVVAFGGPEENAEFCCVSVSTIAYWLIADCIPNGWHMRIYAHLTSLGYLVDARALEWTSACTQPVNDKELTQLRTQIAKRRARQKRFRLAA